MIFLKKITARNDLNQNHLVKTWKNSSENFENNPIKYWHRFRAIPVGNFWTNGIWNYWNVDANLCCTQVIECQIDSMKCQRVYFLACIHRVYWRSHTALKAVTAYSVGTYSRFAELYTGAPAAIVYVRHARIQTQPHRYTGCKKKTPSKETEKRVAFSTL